MKTPMFFQRRFLPMWTALSLGAFTDNMLKQALSIALVFGVITVPGIASDDALPLVGSLFPISMLIFSTVAGQLADKFETSMMFKRAKLAEVFLMALAAVGFLLSSGLILVLALFLMGAQSAVFAPVRTSAMPKYLAANELVRGNAFCGGGLFVSIMIGIVIGGLLITIDGGRAIVAGILVAASLAGWLAIRLAPEATAAAPDLKIDWNPVTQGMQLARFAIHSRGVIRPILGNALYWLIGASVTVAVPLFVRDTLYADETVVTVLMGLFAIGAAIGAIIAAMLARGRSGLGFSSTGIVGAGAMTALIFFLSGSFEPAADGELLGARHFFTHPAAYLLGGAFCLSSIAMGLFVVPLQAAVQRRAPADRRARVLAANNMINACAGMLGSLFILVVTRTVLEPPIVFAAVATLQLVMAVYMIRRKGAVVEGLFDEVLSADSADADSGFPAPLSEPLLRDGDG